MRALYVTLLPLALLSGSAIAGHYSSDNDSPGVAGVRSGNAVVYSVRDFDSVVFGGLGSADIRVGPTWSVRATGPAEAVAKLRVRLDRGELAIDRPNQDDDRNDERDRQVRFAITLPRVSAVGVGGIGHVTVDRVAGGQFKAFVGGSGSLEIERMAVDNATVSIGGSGTVSTAGTAQTLHVSIGGAGRFQAPGLRARGATVTVSGAGVVDTLVDGQASVTTTGAGRVDLGSGARCRITQIGHGQIRCGR